MSIARSTAAAVALLASLVGLSAAANAQSQPNGGRGASALVAPPIRNSSVGAAPGTNVGPTAPRSLGAAPGTSLGTNLPSSQALGAAPGTSIGPVQQR